MLEFGYFRILCFVLLAAVTNSMLFAQNPAISKKYSDKEIADLIQNYEQSNHRDVKVDGVLLQKFRQDFPDARSVEWETNGDVYEVEFEIKNRDFEAYYDKEGNLLMYKQEIHERELPAVVKKAAKAKYPQYRFEDVEKIVKGAQTFYEIEMEFKDVEVKMFITNAGEFMK